MGLIHLDAGVVIGFLDAHDAHHTAATKALRTALQVGDTLAMAASAYAECLVGPSRRGEAAVSVVHDLFRRLPIAVVPLDDAAAQRAASLRATHRSLRFPDALVLATAVETSADRLLTTHHAWPTARRLRIGLTITRL